ncbi:MAG: integration host factor subunit beta [Bdellovibrionaceae bacterium]|nr:integration host factor subunit beta [Pseudobdellovibrionaceae bacterium]
MTRADLIKKLAELLSIPETKAQVSVEAIMESSTLQLIKGGRLEIRGFGTFSVRQYEGRKGRNPRNGRAIRVEPKKLPHFKMAKELKNELIEAYESLNKGDQK